MPEPDGTAEAVRWAIPGTDYPRVLLYLSHLLAVAVGVFVGLLRAGAVP